MSPTGAGPRLVLVRHAKSDYPWGVSDHDRPLNPRGRLDAPEVGGWLDAHVTWPDDAAPAVRVSTARRAQLTWAGARTRLSERWAGADVDDDARIYEAEVPALVAVAADAAGVASTVLLVGHNPGLAELVAWLAADDDLRRRALAKFPTSSVAVLEPLEVAGSAAAGAGASSGSLGDLLMRPASMRVTAFAVPRG